MNCEFCNRQFSTKGILASHQKTAKYCLTLQNKHNENFPCNFCNKNFTSQYNLNEHLTTCKKKQNNEIEFRLKNEYINQIDILKEKIVILQTTQHDNEKSYQIKIDEKNKIIQKLETKLEKFENAVINNNSSHFNENKDNNSHEIPVPLSEKRSSIIIEEIDDDDEYSNITLNNVVISSRPIDHYVNATQLCQAGGKKFNDWFRLDTTKELMNELSSDAGIPASLFVEANRGRTSKYTQGSWIHPDLSIQLAQWISPKFAIQVSKWIRSLFSVGSVEIDLALLRDKDRDIRIKDHRIKQLESVCLSKQRRVEYPKKNVIYILTTDDNLLRRTYIIGKAKNLTNRLGTYNKTCDHTVVHYRECKNEEDMHTAETLVLNKLKDYREQANRDRFILPDGKDISFFTAIVDQCIEFI